MTSLPKNWCEVEIGHVLQPLDNGNVIQQGWSPQCEKEPAADNEWGVLKTTSIQEGCFLSHENKKLPKTLAPKPAIEVKSGDILMTCAGPRNRCGITCFVKKSRPRLMMSGKMYRFRAAPEKIDPKYLEYFLLSQDAKVAIDKMKTGISDSGLNLTHSRFTKLPIPLAPLNEQQRVVFKIEELFSELENATKCMSVAEELRTVFYQSVLDHAFSNCKNNRSLEDLILQKLSNGYSGKPISYETKYKVLSLSSTTTGEFLDHHYKFLDEPGLDDRDIWCSPNDILIQRGNTIEYVGVPAIYTGKSRTFIFPDLMIRIRANEDIIATKFLYYALSSPKIRNYLRQRAKGSAGTMPKINQSILASLPIPFCSKDKQQAIVDKIDELLSNSVAIEHSIQENQSKCQILRQSILKKAFSGQLVAQDPNDEPASILLERIAVSAKGGKKKSTAAPTAVIIPFPHKIPAISVTDLHAGIIALAYNVHEKSPENLKTFGHVKAEKIAHIVEYHLGIDLGRTPVKDAAGPNDYPHLMRVEHRAAMANWFGVQRRGERYVFTKKNGFARLLTKVSHALGKKTAEVHDLIKVFLPMDTQQAEIFATLYAAWNNLLLIGNASPTDEEIVTEAREQWHSSKLQIKREKFFKALGWMRQKSLTPRGMGRLVTTKGTS